MDNLDMLISIYKKWPNDACVSNFPSMMEKFMEMEEVCNYII
jgi:hypothetical protein